MSGLPASRPICGTCATDAEQGTERCVLPQQVSLTATWSSMVAAAATRGASGGRLPVSSAAAGTHT